MKTAIVIAQLRELAEIAELSIGRRRPRDCAVLLEELDAHYESLEYLQAKTNVVDGGGLEDFETEQLLAAVDFIAVNQFPESCELEHRIERFQNESLLEWFMRKASFALLTASFIHIMSNAVDFVEFGLELDWLTQIIERLHRFEKIDRDELSTVESHCSEILSQMRDKLGEIVAVNHAKLKRTSDSSQAYVDESDADSGEGWQREFKAEWSPEDDRSEYRDELEPGWYDEEFEIEADDELELGSPDEEFEVEADDEFFEVLDEMSKTLRTNTEFYREMNWR